MEISISEVQINTNSLLSSIKLDIDVEQKLNILPDSQMALPCIDISDPIVNEPYSLQKRNNPSKAKTDEEQID
jgi:hypothetical protein